MPDDVDDLIKRVERWAGRPVPHYMALRGGPLRRGALTWFSIDGIQGTFRAERFLLRTVHRDTRHVFPLCVEVDGELIPIPFFPFVARHAIRVCVEWRDAGDIGMAAVVGFWERPN